MVARRKQTTSYESQPVRFYKIVALTFLFITLILFGFIVFLSSKRASVTITTRPDAVDITTSIGVNTSGQARNIEGSVQTIHVTATKEFSPTGNREEDAIAAGVVILHNETNIDQPLVATTRLLSADNILFRLEERVLVPANGTVTAAAYADQEGISGNIGPTQFTIPGLHAAKQKQIFAKSDGRMTGGVKTIGVLSSSDVEKAKKELLVDLLSDGKAQFAAEDIDESGVVYDISEESISLDKEIGEEVSSYTLTGSASVVAVRYDLDEVHTLAQDILLSRAIDDAEHIQPSDTAPTVVLAEYDIATASAYLDVTYTGLATINPESKQLEKSVFYGKTKDEVRRYLLSLDHVYGVDVQFRPAWTQTVPHVGEHVSIIVKQDE